MYSASDGKRRDGLIGSGEHGVRSNSFQHTIACDEIVQNQYRAETNRNRACVPGV